MVILFSWLRRPAPLAEAADRAAGEAYPPGHLGAQEPYVDPIFSADHAAEATRLATYATEDDADLADYKEHGLRDYRLLGGTPTTFLSYGDVDLPLRWIEKIEIKSLGCGPRYWCRVRDPAARFMPEPFYRDDNPPEMNLLVRAMPARLAHIVVTTVSGTTHEIYVSRHRLDELYAVLLDAWRHHR